MRFPLPPLLFFGCLAAAAVLQALLPLSVGYPFDTGMAVGAGLLIIAAAMAVLSIRELRRSGTTVDPAERPSHLVTSGPFRFTRNPMYIALMLVLAGIAAMIGSVWFLGAVVALVVLLDRFVVRPEERVVADAFGADYAAYCRRVRRWI